MRNISNADRKRVKECRQCPKCKLFGMCPNFGWHSFTYAELAKMKRNGIL